MEDQNLASKKLAHLLSQLFIIEEQRYVLRFFFPSLCKYRWQNALYKMSVFRQKTTRQNSRCSDESRLKQNRRRRSRDRLSRSNLLFRQNSQRACERARGNHLYWWTVRQGRFRIIDRNLLSRKLLCWCQVRSRHRNRQRSPSARRKRLLTQLSKASMLVKAKTVLKYQKG